MNEINFFYRNNEGNIDSKYFQKSDFLANTRCTTKWSDYQDAWIETCTNYGSSSDDNNPAGTVFSVLLVLIIFTPVVIFLRVFTKEKGNMKNVKTNIQENYLNKVSGVKKLGVEKLSGLTKTDKSNNFDLISFIEELKEDKFPDASIGESFVKGSYVILKDLNGKTIAEIKIPK